MGYSTVKTKKEYLSAEKMNIKSLENCVIEKNKITTRKGFYTSPSDIIFKTDGNEAFEMSFITTDCYLFLDGKYGRVAVNITDNLMGSITYNVMLICADKSTISLGKINFTSSGETFGFPDSFVVFSGRANQGSGIYFLSRRVYGQGLPDMISVRELSSDREEWIMLSESVIYTPLILANGRGEAYHTAENRGRALSLPAPILPESKNMLNPRFKAAYTTDGASSGFSLPFANLDNTSVSADLFYKGNKYSLKITGEDLKSSAVSIDGTAIVMNCDRTEGRVYFTTESGTAWAPEFTGSVNNLCFTAYKTNNEHIGAVGATSASQMLEGGVTLFYKSANAPHMAILNSPSDPLYFPENAACFLGHVEKEIISVIFHSGKLIVFEEGEIYSAEIKTYAGENSSLNVLGEVRTFGEYKISFKKVSALPALPIAETVRSSDGAIFFQSKEGAVWKIKLSGGAATAEKIAELSENYDFALCEGEKYLLIKDNRATVFNKNDDGYSQSVWELPEKAVGGFSYAGKALFFFSFRNDSVYIIYSAQYGSEKDTSYITEHKTQETPIKSGFRVAVAEEEKGGKRIFGLTLYGKGKTVKMSLYNGEKKISSRRSNFKNLVAKFSLGGVCYNGFAEFSFCEGAEIEEICTEYRSVEM